MKTRDIQFNSILKIQVATLRCYSKRQEKKSDKNKGETPKIYTQHVWQILGGGGSIKRGIIQNFTSDARELLERDA